MNNRALSTSLVVIIIVIVIVALVASAFSLGGSPTQNDITVYIDGSPQQVTYSDPQTLDWGAVQAGNTYTRNFTVANTGTQTYNLLLITSEPAGTTQTWLYNNTVLAPNTYSAASLTYTLSTTASTGGCTWRLLTVNSTLPTASPSPNPSATATPNGLSFTINADSNVYSVALTKNNQAPYVITTFPATYQFTAGDNLKFTPVYNDGYTLNGYVFNDGSLPITTPTLTMNNIMEDFTFQVTTKLAPTPSPEP